jgi:glycosyltransferase involved in cell wall biosynthesis
MSLPVLESGLILTVLLKGIRIPLMALKILLVEPYFTGSHKKWAEGYARHSKHEVQILNLEGRYWKWRMHGGAVTLALKFKRLPIRPDLILATDMLDLTTFLALTREGTAGIPAALYFHENQISYPWSPGDRDVRKARDFHYGFINFTSALAAQAVFFNSRYHRDSFLSELPGLLRHFPDHREMDSVALIENKSSILYVGLDFEGLERNRPDHMLREDPPIILWNHRWEYDKNPGDFFRVLTTLAGRGLDFRVVILGESFYKKPGIFEKAASALGHRMLHFGFCREFADYARWLSAADILPVTSSQDFFGISILEAAYSGVLPLLPRRLTYPEIFPEDLFSDLFYTDLDDLTVRLEEMIGGKKIPPRPDISQRAERFAWERLIPQYDEAVENLVKG